MEEKNGVERKIYQLDKPLNRFSRLRYPDEITAETKPFVAARTFADEYPISTGKISELENDYLKEYCPETKKRGDVPKCTASVLRSYHDMFKCSYDYLMGETNNKKIEYATIGQLPVLCKFDDSFWDNIREFAGDNYDSRQNISLLSLLLSEPDNLNTFGSLVLKELYKINEIQHSTLSKDTKEALIGPLEYTLSTAFIKYLYKNLLPQMESLFLHYEQQQKKVDMATEELFDKMFAFVESNKEAGADS